MMFLLILLLCVFFFNDTATTEIYTLSLHDALPIWVRQTLGAMPDHFSNAWVKAAGSEKSRATEICTSRISVDRKSTRLNSSHANISYAVFCLKKKKYNYHYQIRQDTGFYNMYINSY